MTGLEHETPPPPHLRRRVVNTLQERGLLKGGHAWRHVIRSAAAIVLFTSGFAMSRVMAEGEASGPQWLLLLYEDSTFAPAAPIPELVAEYSRWADSLRSEDQLVVGEKLGSGRSVLGGPAAESHSLGELAGLFIIRADDETQAQQIARSCPHLRHGGRVVVRPID